MYGLQAFKEDGSLLFDTQFITYGLLKSGPLRTVDVWSRYRLRSLELNPNDESSWTPYNPHSLITGIDITGAQSPIVFTTGDAVRIGEYVSGSTRTLLFWTADQNCKAYVFDLMRDRGGKTGMQAFDQFGTLTFTTDMPPLNIFASINPPPLDAIIPGTGNLQFPNQQYQVYAGGTIEERFNPWNNTAYYPELKGVGQVHSGHNGEVAAYLTFSRAGGVIWRSGGSFVVNGQGGSQGYVHGTTEGVGGTSNGFVRFFMTPGPTGTTTQFTSNNNTWFDIPRDRAPSALVIRTSEYPYPFG